MPDGGQPNPGINMGAVLSSVNHGNMLSEGGGGAGGGEFGLNKEVQGVLAGQVLGGKGVMAGNFTDMFEMKGGIMQVFPFESFTSGVQSQFSQIVDAPLQAVGNLTPPATPIAGLPSMNQVAFGGSKGGAAPAA